MRNEWERGRREEDGRLSLSLSLSRITSYAISFLRSNGSRLEISSLGDFDYPETRDKSWLSKWLCGSRGDRLLVLPRRNWKEEMVYDNLLESLSRIEVEKRRIDEDFSSTAGTEKITT